jgi:mannan polymerase II complex ANP1 subunit
MGFEVVGLPHYVIWHVYEPSADDLRRMEEMDKEKVVKELDVEDVELSKARWEKDRKVIETIIKNKKSAKLSEETSVGGKKVVVGGKEGPVAHVGEEGVPSDRGNGLTGIEQGKSSQLVEKAGD